MHRRRFLQLDVFADRLLEGNPLAVVVDADGLDPATMQRIAQWTNLSETTFLLPPGRAGADYRVRIFTPRQELPFAGHPSVGSAYAAIEAGMVPADRTTLVQECAAGLLPVRIEGTGQGRAIHVQAPPATVAAISPALAGELGTALGCPLVPAVCGRVDNGPVWLACDLADGASVRALVPDLAAIARICLAHQAVGVCVFGHQPGRPEAMAVRAFCPADGIPEDPVTGSANAAIGAWLLARGRLDRYGERYVASQGREVGRDGRVQVAVDPASGAVWIGGRCVMGVRGEFGLG